MNPADLTTVPSDFYAGPVYQSSTTLKDPEELSHFRTIVAAFFSYSSDCLGKLGKLHNTLATLTEAQKGLLKISSEDRLTKIKEAIAKNQNFLTSVVWDYRGLFEESSVPLLKVPNSYADKIRSVLLQARREWSIQGAEERKSCFDPIIQALQEHFPEPEGVSVLVPGCGLGRLPYEIAQRGFSAQGNEFAYEMLLAGQQIMNDWEGKKFELVPRVMNFSNFWSQADTLQVVKIPDVDKFESGDLSVAAGEFLEVYGDAREEWDAVVTCFFLDTAHNVLEYLQTIHQILKKGGIWVHFGPLQYHYADADDEISLELSWEEIQHAAVVLGFDLLSLQKRTSSYCQSATSMLKVSYECAFAVFKK